MISVILMYDFIDHSLSSYFPNLISDRKDTHCDRQVWMPEWGSRFLQIFRSFKMKPSGVHLGDRRTYMRHLLTAHKAPEFMTSFRAWLYLTKRFWSCYGQVGRWLLHRRIELILRTYENFERMLIYPESLLRSMMWRWLRTHAWSERLVCENKSNSIRQWFFTLGIRPSQCGWRLSNHTSHSMNTISCTHAHHRRTSSSLLLEKTTFLDHWTTDSAMLFGQSSGEASPLCDFDTIGSLTRSAHKDDCFDAVFGPSCQTTLRMKQ